MLVSKINEVYLVLSDLDPSTSQELSEFFTFEVPGFKFMPMYRNRMWDGKIRLFSPATGEIYVGLLPYIKKFCENNKISYILEEGVEDGRRIDAQVVRGFIRSIKPKSKGNLSKYGTIKLMQYGMLLPEIGLCLLALLLLVSH